MKGLAGLGDSLALSRLFMSFDSAEFAEISVGAVEVENLMLAEVDASGRRSRTEIFAIEHLCDAIACLYERYAELLPEGRERAKATARSFGVTLTAPGDIDGYGTVIAPDFESVDHRHLSTWSMRGGGAFLAHNRALQEVAADVVIRTRDVLALAPGALLIQQLPSGTERLGGGPTSGPSRGTPRGTYNGERCAAFRAETAVRPVVMVTGGAVHRVSCRTR